MKNIIIVAVIAVIVGFAARSLYRAKKRGVKCIGCPGGCSCGGTCGGCKSGEENGADQ